MRYLLFNKPYDVLCAFTGEAGQTTLKAYIDVPDVYPAGRLDQDSEGLVFLTDDGPLAHALTSPERRHEKTYLVMVEGNIPPEALAKLQAGMEVKGVRVGRIKALVIPQPELWERSKPVTPHGPTTWLRLTLTEGKKRQIRHMTAAVGYPTLRLVRVAIDVLALGDLLPGQWRDLSDAELALLKKSIASTRPRRGTPAQPPRRRST